MPSNYQPGDEIQLDSGAKHKLFAKALSWSEQKKMRPEIGAIDDIEGYEERTDAALEFIASKLTKVEPTIEITGDSLGDILDHSQIFQTLWALQQNLTVSEKKS